MKTNKKELGKEQNTKIESEKTENNKSIETDEKNSTTIEGKKPSLDDLSPKSKKFAKIYCDYCGRSSLDLCVLQPDRILFELQG